MIKGRNIAAGRALLSWTTNDLADAASISPTTVSQIEKGVGTAPNARTVDKIYRAFARAGVEIMDDGARVRSPITILTGPTWFLELLGEIEATLQNLRNKEMLIWFSDDRKSPPAVIEKYRELRGQGITMRQLVEAGNTYLSGPLDEYRYLPSHLFKNWVTVVFGDCVASSLDEENGCTLVRDKNLAAAERLKFELVWSTSPKPTESNADVRF